MKGWSRRKREIKKKDNMATQIELVMDGKELESESGWNIAVKQLQMGLEDLVLIPDADRRVVGGYIDDVLTLVEAKERLRLEADRMGITLSESDAWHQMENACDVVCERAEKVCARYGEIEFFVRLRSHLHIKELFNPEDE